MGLTFTEEQLEFRRTLRAFLADKSPEREVRRLMDSAEGYDPAVWQQLAQQLGVQGLAVPEQYGGSGCSFVEVAIALEEAGRALLCAPLLSAVIASTVVERFGDDSLKDELLPVLASGEAIVGLAITDEDGAWAVDRPTVQATSTDAGWTITGVKSYVLDGAIADHLLVTARAGDDVGVFVVATSDPGVVVTPLPTFDQTRRLARVDLDGAAALAVGAENRLRAAYDGLLQVAPIALASEQAGLAERIMEMAVDYAKERIQFGRAIGSFQAIKHKCADLLVAVESAKSSAYVAAEALAEASAELPELTPLAASFCSEAAAFVAHENIQIHGAIAYTWEYPAHLYYRRAKSSEVLFGDTAWHREQLASVIGL